MAWRHALELPGSEPPSIGFLLIIGLLVLCFVGIILYLVFTGRIQDEAERDPNLSPEELESGGATEESESQKYEWDETS